MNKINLTGAETIGRNSKIIPEIRSLRFKKNIMELGLFIIEGKKAVYETLCDEAYLPNIKYIVISDEIDFNYIEKISFINSNKCVKIYIISSDLFHKISGDEAPEGVLCVSSVPARDINSLVADGEKRMFILLDSINDPGNLGTIIRAADNFSVSAVLLGQNSVFEYSPKVIKASMGSFKNVISARIDEGLYGALLTEVQKNETAVVCSKIDANSTLCEAALKVKEGRYRKIIIIGGSESHGVAGAEIKKLIGAAAKLIYASIPNYGRNESLNLSVAIGIFCYEMAGAMRS